MHANSQIILKPNNSSLFDRCLKTVTLKISIRVTEPTLVVVDLSNVKDLKHLASQSYSQ